MTAWVLRLRLLLFLFLFLQLRAEAQQGVTTFGMQVKPVVPLSFFDPRVEVQYGALSGSVELTGGFGFGMQVRHGFTRMLSLETGIHQIRRSYRWELLNDKWVKRAPNLSPDGESVVEIRKLMDIEDFGEDFTLNAEIAKVKY